MFLGNTLSFHKKVLKSIGFGKEKNQLLSHYKDEDLINQQEPFSINLETKYEIEEFSQLWSIERCIEQQVVRTQAHRTKINVMIYPWRWLHYIEKVHDYFGCCDYSLEKSKKILLELIINYYTEVENKRIVVSEDICGPYESNGAPPLFSRLMFCQSIEDLAKEGYFRIRMVQINLSSSPRQVHIPPLRNDLLYKNSEQFLPARCFEYLLELAPKFIKKVSEIDKEQKIYYLDIKNGLLKSNEGWSKQLDIKGNDFKILKEFMKRPGYSIDTREVIGWKYPKYCKDDTNELAKSLRSKLKLDSTYIKNKNGYLSLVSVNILDLNKK